MNDKELKVVIVLFHPGPMPKIKGVEGGRKIIIEFPLDLILHFLIRTPLSTLWKEGGR